MRIPIPLLLFWPILLALGILLAPIAIITCLVFVPYGKKLTAIKAGPRLFSVFCALRGLKVDVRSDEEKIYIVFV